jgi:hypothetical protein
MAAAIGGRNTGLAGKSKKPPPRGWCGGGFSQYETTRCPHVAPSQDLFPSKKAAAGVEISDGFSTLRTRVTHQKKVTADGDGMRLIKLKGRGTKFDPRAYDLRAFAER